MQSEAPPSSKEVIGEPCVVCAVWISRQGVIGSLLRLFKGTTNQNRRRNLDLHKVIYVAVMAYRTARS
jgi:hypothetical protein